MSCTLILSLALVLGLLHLPTNGSESRVGWDYRSAYDPIPLSALEEETEPSEMENRPPPVEDTPPPTLYTTEETPLASETDGDGSDASSEDDASTARAPSPDSSARHRPIRMTALAQSERPEIVGGEGTLYLNIKYPEEAREKGIEGQLVLGFLVTEEGETRDIHVLKSLHPTCDSAAVRALRAVQFVPGKQNGEPVAVRMRLPIRFRLLPGLKASSTSSSSAPSQQ